MFKCLSFGEFQKSQSNVSRIFKEPSTDVCFKNISRISLEYCKVMKKSLEVKKLKKLFCELSCENFNIVSHLSCKFFLSFIGTILHLE